MKATGKIFIPSSGKKVLASSFQLPSNMAGEYTFTPPSSQIVPINSGLKSVNNSFSLCPIAVSNGYGPMYSPKYPIMMQLVYNPKDYDPRHLCEEDTNELKKSKLYSIDVECVATGTRHCDRDVARIAVVNALCEVVYESFVKPSIPVVSYLTPLTGITENDLCRAPSLEVCKKELSKILPRDSILVGQGIGHDINWMNFRSGVDYSIAYDLGKIFQYPSVAELGQSFRPKTFSLRQEVCSLIGVDIQSSWHNPIIDATYSMKLFRNCNKEELDKLRYFLYCQETPKYRSVPTYIEGVELRHLGLPRKELFGSN